MRGAYDALVSMGIIAYFIPFLFMFAAMIVLQREPAGPDVMRVPGGKPVAVALALGRIRRHRDRRSCWRAFPPDEEPNKTFCGDQGRRARRSCSSAIGVVVYLLDGTGRGPPSADAR